MACKKESLELEAQWTGSSLHFVLRDNILRCNLLFCLIGHFGSLKDVVIAFSTITFVFPNYDNFYCLKRNSIHFSFLIKLMMIKVENYTKHPL